MAVPSVVPLAEAADAALYGGKAAALAVALRGGLPVPGGVAVPADLVAALVAGDEGARAAVAAGLARVPGPLAVRSSAVGEDGAASSFAGQHLTELNVVGIEAALAAVAAVGRSAGEESAAAYRARRGLDADTPACGVVVQTLVAAEVAGVLFTRNPVTGADECVIEASWALGEAVVAGLVTPDLYRLARDGTVLEAVLGRKEVAVVALPGGGTGTRPATPEESARPCLDGARLAALARLAQACDAVFGPDPHDIEWAFGGGGVALLQRRPVTAAF
jgi:pyruvate, water dikinase